MMTEHTKTRCDGQDTPPLEAGGLSNIYEFRDGKILPLAYPFPDDAHIDEQGYSTTEEESEKFAIWERHEAGCDFPFVVEVSPTGEDGQFFLIFVRDLPGLFELIGKLEPLHRLELLSSIDRQLAAIDAALQEKGGCDD